jgi:hypothetical protein
MQCGIFGDPISEAFNTRITKSRIRVKKIGAMNHNSEPHKRLNSMK